MNKSNETVIKKIIQSAQDNPSIEVLWLYGSRAKGNWQDNSDYDLAVAFSASVAFDSSISDQGYPCDDLAFQWSELTGQKISLVDINKVPAPLAVTIINEGKLVLSKNDLRLHSEMQRVWSIWERYRYEHRKQQP